MSSPTFSSLPYQRPVLSELTQQHELLTKRLESATTDAEAIQVVRDWNVHRINVSTMGSLAEVHFTQNVSDVAAKEEKLFYDENSPSIAELDIAFARSILSSPYRGVIAATFGELFLTRLHNASLTFEPSIKDLLVHESELCRTYNELTASAHIEVDGET